MNRVLFLQTHLGSGSECLFRSLDNHPRIQGCNFGQYNDPLDIVRLLELEHKNKNSASIYLDELRFNHSIASKWVYRHAMHLFFIREPQGSLNEIVHAQKYDCHKALRYYSSRLRRLCSIARAAGGVLLTEEDLARGEGTQLVENMLRINIPPIQFSLADIPQTVPLSVVDKGSEYYEKYLFYLRNCGLISTKQFNPAIDPVD